MSRGKHLTETEVEWAWQKWNEGYLQKSIAKALNCNIATINRKFGTLQDNGRKKQFVSRLVTRELPELEYDHA